MLQRGWQFIRPHQQTSQAQMSTSSMTRTHTGLGLAFKHIAKVGGTTVHRVLKDMMSECADCPPLYTVNEHHSLPAAVNKEYFVITGVRNPCDYYLSMWAYEHDKDFVHALDAEHNNLLFDFETDLHSNTTKFENWLAVINSGSNGLMSVRYWENFVDRPDKLTCMCETKYASSCQEHMNDSAVDASLATFDPTRAADCWYRLEHLTDDLESCLKEYERRSGTHLKWEVFSAYRNLTKNPSDHEPCEFYYSNSSAATLVRNADNHIFHTFGYSSCCGGSAVNSSLWAT